MRIKITRRTDKGVTPMRSTRLGLTIAALLLAAPILFAESPNLEPLTLEEFNQVRVTLETPVKYPWYRVHWEGTLWDAQARAAREGKPIAVFVTGGEPLGIC
jgi:membrane protein implicated in regulation of membrane protease activity